MNDKTPWPNFKWHELACRCGQCDESTAFNVSLILMHHIQILRDQCGFPFEVTSAYRCRHHPDEKEKASPGTHNRGLAIDIQVSGEQAHSLLTHAMIMGCFTGIGIHQKGPYDRRFIHLDISTTHPRPWVWSY